MKKSLFFFLLVSITFSSFASSISVAKAEIIAKKAYFHRLNKYVKDIPFDKISIEETFTIQRDGVSAYYIFNMTDMGFIAIAAEDKMTPVLAYDFDSPYDSNNIPESFESWMNERIDNILFLKNSSAKTDQEVKLKWSFLENLDPTQTISKSSKGVEPLLWSIWDQGYPFNYDCPVDGGPGGRVWAGCVATAYSQVMYYWRWPYTGTSSYCYTPSGYDEQCADFENTTYDWDGMLDSQAYKDASAEIAELLHHTGIAVDMMYSPDGSGAYSDDVVTALKEYFRYSDETELIFRGDGYSTEEWKNICQAQLDNGFPMYYAGCQGKGCHAFVLDGYNDDDEYHFNLGWNGSANGWYSIDNPGGFPVWQQVIINSYPNDEYPIYPSGVKEINFPKGVITDGSGPLLDYQNNTDAAWKIDYSNGSQNVETITLEFLEMKIADGDYIHIYDGEDASAPLLGSYNTLNYPASLTSSGDAIFIKMETDETLTDKGFRIRYEANEIEFVDFLTLTDFEGVIEDGSGENFNYQDAQTSLWKIELDGVEKIYFNFDYLKTQDNYDIVRFVNAETGEYVATLSGNYDENNLPTVVVDASSAFVLFRSDVLHTDEGFKLHYNAQLVGTKEIEGEGAEFNIFPNPANTELTIQFEQSTKSNIEIEIYDSQSKVIYQSEIKDFFGNYLNEINLENFSKGIYYIKVTNDENTYHQKFIKQ